MAGVLEEGLATEQPPSSKEFSSVYGRWDVQYARFVVFPSSPHASHPSLVPHSATTRKARRGGKWISTSPYTSTAASLKLHAVRDGDLIDLILVVSIGSKTLEEHYISRLHYAWPQVSCVSGFPSRGTRSVFFSYKDGAGQIQKFGLRFLTIYEIEKFMTDLKESFEDVNSIPLLSYPPVASGSSSQSEFIPTDEASHRVIKERTPSTSEGTYEIQTSKSYGVSQDSNAQETRLQREVEEVLSSFPPSFTSFLKSCGPAIDEQAQPTTSQDLDLKAQIAKYMEDASFQDMLLKVEKVINEVGDFSILL